MPALLILAVVVLVILLRGVSRDSGGVGGGGTTVLIPSPSPSPGGGNNGIDNLTEAIFRYEGGQPGNINVRNNNPGNLIAGPGMTGSSSGYATFADQGDGWDALSSFITKKVSANPTWDLYDFTNYYVHGSTTAKSDGMSFDGPSNSDNYADFISNYTGWDPLTPVSQDLGGN